MSKEDKFQVGGIQKVPWFNKEYIRRIGGLVVAGGFCLSIGVTGGYIWANGSESERIKGVKSEAARLARENSNVNELLNILKQENSSLQLLNKGIVDKTKQELQFKNPFYNQEFLSHIPYKDGFFNGYFLEDQNPDSKNKYIFLRVIYPKKGKTQKTFGIYPLDITKLKYSENGSIDYSAGLPFIGQSFIKSDKEIPVPIKQMNSCENKTIITLNLNNQELSGCVMNKEVENKGLEQIFQTINSSNSEFYPMKGDSGIISRTNAAITSNPQEYIGTNNDVYNLYNEYMICLGLDSNLIAHKLTTLKELYNPVK